MKTGRSQRSGSLQTRPSTKAVDGVAKAQVALKLDLSEAYIDAVEEGEQVANHDEGQESPLDLLNDVIVGVGALRCCDGSVAHYPPLCGAKPNTPQSQAGALFRTGSGSGLGQPHLLVIWKSNG